MRVSADSGSPCEPVQRISCSRARDVVEVGRLDEHVVRHVDVAEVARDVHVAAHRAADDDDLAAGVDADVDRLLHAVDVRREARDEDAAAARRDDLPERLADDALGAREARALGVRRVAEQQVDAAVAELGEPADVGAQPVDRRVVELPVAGVEDAARRSSRSRCRRVRDRVRHADELEPERPELDRAALGVDLAQLGRAQQAVLVELRLDEAEREPRRPDLVDLHLAHQERQRADVVLVRVGEHDRADLLVAEVAEVREDQVDAEVLVARERHAGVDDDPLAADLVDGHVLADLAEAAERDHAQYVAIRRGSVGGGAFRRATRRPSRSRQPRTARDLVLGRRRRAAAGARRPRARAGSAPP